MRAKMIMLLAAAYGLLAACDARDAIYEQTLTQSCGEKCYFWGQTDRDRGAIGADGMRIYVEPSFGDFDYRFEIVPQPAGCTALWADEEFDEQKDYCRFYLVNMRKAATQRRNDGLAPRYEDYSFVLPEEDGRELFDVVDQLSDRWRGGGDMLLDGTSVSFELAKHGMVRSMRSNSLLERDHTNPAAWAGAEMHRFALAYGPSGQIPRGHDWHSYVSDDGQFPCNQPGLNAPDTDGFGAGDDLCALSLVPKSAQ